MFIRGSIIFLVNDVGNFEFLFLKEWGWIFIWNYIKKLVLKWIKVLNILFIIVKFLEDSIE